MESNNQKQQRRPCDSDSDSNKKESTNSGGNDDTPSTSSSKPKDIIHDDLCSICYDDVSMLDVETFSICTGCGKVIHTKCNAQLHSTKSLSVETRLSCPMCRALAVAPGSKENIERLQRWSALGRSWAQFCLAGLYDRGIGVKVDPKRVCD